MKKRTIHTGAQDGMLRRAEKKDTERLIELMDQLGYKTKIPVLQRNLHIYGDSVLVYEIKAQVMGCLAYHILPLFHSEQLFMRIVSLVVDQMYRGKGVGKKLLEEAEKIAKEKGCEAIELTSAMHRMKSGAHAFYRELGYSDGETVYFRKKLPSEDPEEEDGDRDLGANHHENPVEMPVDE